MTEKKLLKGIAEIMKKIAVAKTSIDAGSAGKYNAFTIDKVLDQTRNLLPLQNICTFITHELYENQYITKNTKYGEKTTHNVIVKTIVTFYHAETEEQYCSVAFGEASDAGDKALSKAQTDGFKKVLCQVFHLSDDDGDKDLTATDQSEKIVNVEKKQNIKEVNTKKPEIQNHQNNDVKNFNYEDFKEQILLSNTLDEFKKFINLAKLHKTQMSEEQQIEMRNIIENKTVYFNETKKT